MAANAPQDETLDQFFQRVGAVQTNQPYTGPVPDEIKQTYKKKQSLLQAVGSDILAGSDKVNNLANTLRLPELAGGMIQGAADAGRSVVNLIPGVNLPRTDLSKYVKQDPVSQAAFSLGTLPPQLATWSEGMQGLKNIPKLSGGGLLPTAGRGAIMGGALSDDNRGTGALFGAAFAPLNELGANKLADSVIARKKSLLSDYSDKFKGLFDEIDKRGISKVDNVKDSSFDIGAMLGNGSVASARREYIKPLQRYIEEPTFQNAHTAQSQLGKLIGQMSTTKKAVSHGLSETDQQSLNSLINARQKILGQAFTTLNKNGAGDIAQKFGDLQEGYKNEVVPYFNSMINDYEKNKISSKYLVNHLPNQKYFQNTAEQFHPDLQRRSTVSNLAQKATNMAGWYGGYSLLSSLGLLPNNNFSFGGGS